MSGENRECHRYGEFLEVSETVREEVNNWVPAEGEAGDGEAEAEMEAGWDTTAEAKAETAAGVEKTGQK